MPRKILITGATGFIGKKICNKLIELENEVTVLTSNPEKAKSTLVGIKKYVQWNYKRFDTLLDTIENIDTIIHLSGASIAGRRWTKEVKQEIINSRVESTKFLVNAIGKAIKKPETFICASAVGYYGTSETETFTEENSAGNDFLSTVCKQWENETSKVEQYGVRRVSIRTGVVLDKYEGALSLMLIPYKCFIGGPLGSGKQWLSWIHINDITDVYIRCISDEKLEGAINGTAPFPVRMAEFAKELGRALKRPSVIKTPAILLKMALGEAADIILKGQRVIPSKLLDNSFRFSYTNIRDVFRQII